MEFLVGVFSVVVEKVVEIEGCGFESVVAGTGGNFVFFGVRMLETASEMRWKGRVVNFAIGGGLVRDSVCERPVSGEFGGEIARFG